MDRYGSGYPCIAGSGGIRVVRCVSTRAAGGPSYVTCIVPFPALPLVPSQYEYLFGASFTPPQLLYCVGVSTLTAKSLLISSEVVRDNRDLLFISVLLLSSAFWF